MARPVKQGLDYFSMDVDLDDKFELIEAKHGKNGIAAFGIIVKLFQRIYKEGYYLPWNDDMVLLFSKRNNVDINLVNEVINDCLRYNIFDNVLFNELQILTSSGIQKRYLKAIERRKSIELDKNIIIVDINSINVHINWINTYIGTQRKGKERKEKKEEEKKDFIDEIVNAFLLIYKNSFSEEYVVTNLAKERSAAGKLLKLFKEKHPAASAEKMHILFQKYFAAACMVESEWYRTNMSLSILYSKYNEILKLIQGTATKPVYYTWNEITKKVNSGEKQDMYQRLRDGRWVSKADITKFNLHHPTNAIQTRQDPAPLEQASRPLC